MSTLNSCSAILLASRGLWVAVSSFGNDSMHIEYVRSANSILRPQGPTHQVLRLLFELSQTSFSWHARLDHNGVEKSVLDSGLSCGCESFLTAHLGMPNRKLSNDKASASNRRSG